jgi:hypothetical protein
MTARTWFFETLSTATLAKPAFCSPAIHPSEEDLLGTPEQVMLWRIFTEQIHSGGIIP